MRAIGICLAGLAFLSLQACASTSSSSLQASAASTKSCQAQGLVFTRDKNGKGFCVTEAQATCQANAWLVLDHPDCLNSLAWKREAPPGESKKP